MKPLVIICANCKKEYEESELAWLNRCIIQREPLCPKCNKAKKPFIRKEGKSK